MALALQVSMRGLSIVVALAVSLLIAPSLRAAPTSVDGQPQLEDELSTPVDATAQIDAPSFHRKRWPEDFQLRLDGTGTDEAGADLPSPDQAAKPTERRWYGYELIISGTLALVLLTRKTVPGAAAGVGTYVLGGPVIHLAEGQPLKSLVSFGLRSIPVFLTVAAFAGESEELAVLAVLSVMPVAGFDAGAIAWEDPAPAKKRPSFSAAPSIVVTHTAVAASLSGTF